MDRKKYTLLLISNRKGKTKSFTLSSALLKSGVALTCFMAVLMATVVADYTGLLLQSNENKRLKADNALLKRQFEVVESKLHSLEQGLERVKSFETKLKMISNLDDEDRALNLAMGPMPRRDFNFKGLGDKRAPASEFLVRDSVFTQQPPLQKEKGELAFNTARDYASLSIRIDRAVKVTKLREQGIIELYESLSDRQSLMNATPNIKPARGWFTSRFGYRIDPFSGKPVMHSGLDIAAPPGTPVYSPADGVVSYVGYESGYGNLISIDHGFGVVTRFAHNSRVFVQVGQKISRKDVIASVGNTGRSSGPHLHYEIRVNGVPVDPMNYILVE